MPFVFKSTELAKLMIPYPVPDGYLGLVIDACGFLSFEYLLNPIMVNGVFYVNVQKALKEHAIVIAKRSTNTTSATGQKRSQQMQLITALYINHIKVKKLINSTLGVVPLTSFIGLFILYTDGITFVIIFQPGFSLLFLITCICGFAVFFTWFVYYLVCNGKRATEELEVCYIKITQLLADSTSSDNQSAKDERGLYRAITCLGVEQASAYGLFNIDETLTLSFPNAMIPFLVMIITGYNSMSGSRTSTIGGVASNSTVGTR